VALGDECEVLLGLRCDELVDLVGDSIGDGPGGECSGLVDVDCDDYACSWWTPGDCWFERHCVVWVTYLDMIMPEELDRAGVCQDNPYAGYYR
jgi:hypothetical protein